jgi:hypothetical protein
VESLLALQAKGKLPTVVNVPATVHGDTPAPRQVSVPAVVL